MYGQSCVRTVNNKHMDTSYIRCALITIIIIKLHVALQYSMASNIEREGESDERREERLKRRKGNC